MCPSTAAGGAVNFLCTAAPAAGSGVFCARRLLQLGQSLLVLRLRCLLELVVRLLLLRCMVCRACLVCLALPAVPGAPGAPGVPSAPGVPGVACCAWCAWRAWRPWCAWRAWYAWRAWCAWCTWRAWRAWSYALSGDFLSSGCRRRSASGGFDWRDVAQVAVPFACGLFSSVGRFYRSSSVRGSGPGVSSTRFWSLLHWRRFSVVLPAALVDCCLASLRAGVGSPPWRWRISARVLMVACFPLLRGRRSAPSRIPWPFLDLTLVLSRCKNLAWLVS